MFNYATKFIVMCVMLGATHAFATDTAVRTYSLPDHGKIELAVPKDWQDKVRQPPNRFPPTIIFTPETGGAFKVLLTPMWRMGKDVAAPDIDHLKEEIEYAAENAKSQSVEESIRVKEIKGVSGTGYYFSATGRAPKKGEFKHVTQGVLPLGEIMAVFTVLSNDMDGHIAAESLHILSGAIHVNSEIPSTE